MKLLTLLVQQKGAKLVTGSLTGDLLNHEDDLCAEYNAKVIVNATGLAGNELADDDSCTLFVAD